MLNHIVKAILKAALTAGICRQSVSLGRLSKTVLPQLQAALVVLPILARTVVAGQRSVALLVLRIQLAGTANSGKLQGFGLPLMVFSVQTICGE